ncbi:MAG: DUF2188 domain-containing protein [bacterium]|nr:DUF2188 domain-containing protein [bacterium]
MRTIIHVVPHRGGLTIRWGVKYANGLTYLHINADKVAAVAYALSLAKNLRPSQVKIHRHDGVIQEERTFGQDPERYLG